KRERISASHSLSRALLLPPNIPVVGMARRPVSDDDFRAQMREGCDKFARRRPVDAQLWQSFAQGIFYVNGEFHDPEAYQRLKAKLDEIDKARGIPGKPMFYLSTPPTSFPPILEQLGKEGMINRDGERPFTRIIVEKPFGTDLDSARKLNREVQTVAQENQIYRIDHYLGKETVQNLLVFRFANGIFEPIWNQKYVDQV